MVVTDEEATNTCAADGSIISNRPEPETWADYPQGKA